VQLTLLPAAAAAAAVAAAAAAAVAAAAAAAADTSFFGSDMLPDSDSDNSGLPNFKGNNVTRQATCYITLGAVGSSCLSSVNNPIARLRQQQHTRRASNRSAVKLFVIAFVQKTCKHFDCNSK
jgi:hypothetical protein